LLALAGWAVDVGIATLIYSLGTFDLNRGWEHFSIFTGMSGVFGILLAVIWLPVAIIAGSRSRKKGFKAVFTVVLITSIIAPILIGCGFGLLAAYFG
jgi:hypothetical protein